MRAQSAPGTALQFSYLVDVDGDGALDEADTALMERALFTSRGFEIDPRPGYDHRADIFGKARVDQESVDALASGMARFGNMAVPAPRPITVAWHYGWYDSRERPLLHQTVRYLGGDYLSSDSGVETEFNRLKNEFGVTVDALGWMRGRLDALAAAHAQAQAQADAAAEVDALATEGGTQAAVAPPLPAPGGGTVTAAGSSTATTSGD